MQKASKRLLLEQTKSQIGHPEKHRKVLRALGLRRIGKQVTKPDNPSVSGMIERVSHLVKVTEVDGEADTQ